MNDLLKTILMLKLGCEWENFMEGYDLEPETAQAIEEELTGKISAVESAINNLHKEYIPVEWLEKQIESFISKPYKNALRAAIDNWRNENARD